MNIDRLKIQILRFKSSVMRTSRHTYLAVLIETRISDVYLTLRKIAIWLSKNCQKLDIFSKKIAKNFHFFLKNCHWQFFWSPLSLWVLYCTKSCSRSPPMESGHLTHTSRTAFRPTAITSDEFLSAIKLLAIVCGKHDRWLTLSMPN